MTSQESKNQKINISQNTQSPLFIDIDPNNPVSEIESLCMNCQKTGTSRILLTKIPFFKEIILMSFSCPHCGFRNNEIEQGEGLAPQGIHFELNVQTENDLNRRVIKSNFCSINVPICGLEIPQNTQKGKLTTVEGFIQSARDNFKNSLDDGYYAEMGEEFIGKIKDLIEKLSEVLEGKKFPFQFIMDDPSGNSFIENPYAPQSDPNIKVTYFDRTKEMIESMGYSYENQLEEMGKEKDKKEEINNNNSNKSNQVHPSYYDKKKDFTVYKTNSEISNKIIDFTKGIDEKDSEELDKYSMSFPTKCFVCGEDGFMRSCLCTIPYFKEIIIYCFKCEKCGYKTTEVKGGGGISEKGQKITLKVESQDDLNRDLFKSESSKIIIPEIGFESSDGSLGSMYTTVEGVIEKLYNNLKESPFGIGDSKLSNKFEEFLKKLKDLKELKQKFTLIIDDPLSNSFIFPIGEPKDDKNLIKEDYERTFEQNEEFGINDMKVENYESENDKKEENNSNGV